MPITEFSSVLPSGSGVHTLFNMSEEEIPVIESRLRPGGYSSEGFLAESESFREVCIKDLTTLSKLGITCDQISYSLRGLVRKADQIVQKQQIGHCIEELMFSPIPNKIPLGNKFEMSGVTTATNGSQECPFHEIANNPRTGNREFSVKNLKTNESISFSALVIDLIGKHAFFEGNTEYRVDPEKLCRVLDLKPGEHKKVTEKTWVFQSCGHEIGPAEEAAKKYAEQICEIDADATAYLGIPFQNHEKYKYRGLTEREKIWKQGKSEGKSDEDIERTLQFYAHSTINLDQQVFVDDGKKYCHIFNRRTRETLEQFEVDGMKVDKLFEFSAFMIFEAHEETYADISTEI